MKSFLVAFPVLFCLAAVASSQSLVDVAKKEKERRAENARLGIKTTFEAEAVGSFGRVWWRAEDVETPLGDADSTEPAQHEEPTTEESAAETVEREPTADADKLSRRGDLPLRKSSGRRR